MFNSTQDYCTKECPVGKAEVTRLLDLHNSVFDAVFDMQDFIKECSKTCTRCQQCQK